MKPLAEMTPEEPTEALEALDDVRPEDTAPRPALYPEPRRSATEKRACDEGADMSETV